MRKIEITNKLIEYLRDVLDEIESNGDVEFEEYWKNLTIKDIVVNSLTGPNYYNGNNDPLEDFIEMRKMKYNEKDNTIDFDVSEHVNIFLDRVGYNSNEILKIERSEKLKRLKNLIL